MSCPRTPLNRLRCRSDLRQRLAEEEGLTEEQRAELSAQLESIKQSISVMETTLASAVPDATESAALGNG